jgi:hypothetical protein
MMMIMTTAPTGQNSRVGRRLHDYICRLGGPVSSVTSAIKKAAMEKIRSGADIRPPSCTVAQLTETSRLQFAPLNQHGRPTGYAG